MDGLSEFFTWKYIIGVLLAGLLINILSHYLISPIDDLFGSISSGWRIRSERAKKKHEDILNTYDRDPVLLLLLVQGQIHRHMVILMLLLTALIILVVGSSPTLLAGEMLESPKQIKSLALFILIAAASCYVNLINPINLLRTLGKRRYAAAKKGNP
jgi:hypothetical protein